VSDLTEAQLVEWERIIAEATPGPWEVHAPLDGRKPGVFVARARGLGVPPKFYVAFLPEMDPCDALRDARLIAAARTAVPALIAELRRLRALSAPPAPALASPASLPRKVHVRRLDADASDTYDAEVWETDLDGQDILVASVRVADDAETIARLLGDEPPKPYPEVEGADEPKMEKPPALASPGETAREPMIEVPDWIPDDLGEATKAVRECASQIAFAFLQGRALAAPRSSGTPETAPFMLPQNRRAPTGTSPDLESDPRRKVCGCGAILFPDQICPCAPAPETATTARETEVPRERLALLEGLRIEAAAVARRLHGQNVVQRLAIALDLVDTVRPSWPASPSPAQEDRDG
jgi:hypothetical protein